MPALWQSSQRPMYVRTVWVDGFRHAILTQDDPYLIKLNSRKRRPHSSVSTKTTSQKICSSRLNRQTDNLEDCLKQLNFVITSNKPKIENKRPKSSQEPYIEKLNLRDIKQESEDEFVIVALPQPLNDFESSRSKFNTLPLNMRMLRSHKTARVETKENTELCDRVLQWLDLAGKIDMLSPENAERITQPRHSWPEIQKRNNNLIKSKTSTDLRVKESKTCTPNTGRGQQSGTIIDRHDFYMPTSANTIENYARQSRNVKSTPRNETNHKTKDNIVNNKHRDLRTNVMETRQKIASERTAIEKQYAELVSKKLIPDLGKSTKRQVHIFMPDIPKRYGSNLTSRTESLLSHVS